MAAGLLAATGCVVAERCYRDSDCPAQHTCTADGRCTPRPEECRSAADCAPGDDCVAYRCYPAARGSITCPADMLPIPPEKGVYCVDRYEASRPDATADRAGDPSLDDLTPPPAAQSREGVRPWEVTSNAIAQAACSAAGKRLCQPSEWEFACRGPADTEYAYGDPYDPEICNGIDTFPDGRFRLMPTGSFPGCTNSFGLFDINGNLWEHTLGGDDRQVRGGAYNCADSATLHRCDYVPRTWAPAARGFRCCYGSEGAVPPPPTDVTGGDTTPPRDTDTVQDSGCLEDPDIPTPDIVIPDVAPDVAPDVIPDVAPDVAPDLPRDVPTPDAPDATAPQCPPDMVLVTPAGAAAFCMDRYEASRDDANASFQGESHAIARSRAGVLPWQDRHLVPAVAAAACVAAGKRLCRRDEWFTVCTGPAGRAYVYGDTYDAETCNGIDTFCTCDAPACASLAECPYPRCVSQPSPEGGGPCGALFRAQPTGSFPDCVNEWGAYDVVGNVWELVATGDEVIEFRGGAYNCGDSPALHRCDFVGGDWASAQGFRCCGDPVQP